MPYPAARENPESTPCVKKLRGSSKGVREAAKNSVPRIRPLVENECHGPLPIWPHLSIPGGRQLRRQLLASDLMAQAVAGAANRSMIHLLHWRAPDAWAPGIHVRAHWGLLCPAGAALRYRMPQPAWAAAFLRNGWLIVG